MCDDLKVVLKLVDDDLLQLQQHGQLGLLAQQLAPHLIRLRDFQELISLLVGEAFAAGVPTFDFSLEKID